MGSRGPSVQKPKSNFAKRLDYLLGGEKISHFATRSGVSQSALSRYYGGAAPKYEALEKIIKTTGCDGHWLMTGEGEPFPDEPEATQERGRINIPTVGLVAADDSLGSRVHFEHDIVEHDVVEISPKTAAMEITGHSMAPLVYPGQKVIIDINDRSAHDADLVVVETAQGHTYFKRFFQDSTDRDWIILESTNPLTHEPPVRIKWDDVKRLHVVVGVWYG